MSTMHQCYQDNSKIDTLKWQLNLLGSASVLEVKGQDSLLVEMHLQKLSALCNDTVPKEQLGPIGSTKELSCWPPLTRHERPEATIVPPNAYRLAAMIVGLQIPAQMTLHMHVQGIAIALNITNNALLYAIRN